MRSLSFRIVLVVLLFALQGCDNTSSKVIGKWKVVGDSSDVVWDFAKDGNVAIGDTAGRYSFGDGGRIKIQTARATFVHQLEFAGDHMIWTDANGSRTELARVP